MFDYIIVGAGSAGCVLANRLSADPKINVLLVEAGPSDDHPYINMPRALVKLLSNKRYMWHYQAEPVPGGRNEPHVWVRGKTLGGSSSVNGMVYIRGQAEDYESWAANGAPGWGWPTISRCFKAIENHELGAGPERGAGGPLYVSVSRERIELCDAFIDAVAATGVPAKADLNDGNQVGVGYHPRTIKHGRRFSAARAFLLPTADRANLRIATGAMVEKIVFEGRRAVGIQTVGPQGREIHNCAGEIIVAAGGLNSPTLLQLSGIGDAEHLGGLGLTVVQHSPNVGENMREHWLLPVEFRLVGAGSRNQEYRGARLVLNTLRYALLGGGPLTAAAYEAGAFIKTDPTLDRADAQVLMGPFTIDRAAGFVIDRKPGAQCAGTVLRPESQGTIRIKSADPLVPPVIRPNYLTAEYDRQTSIRIYRWIQKIAAMPGLAKYIRSQLSPLPAERSDDEILDAFRRQGVAGYHAAGTCRMGIDRASVVDERLRVRGVAGLRVMDCSVMPTLVSGNTNGPVMAMAWHASDLIVEDRVAGRLARVA